MLAPLYVIKSERWETMRQVGARRKVYKGDVLLGPYLAWETEEV